MQTAFFGYVTLFDQQLRVHRWIEAPVTTAISILDDGWNVRAVWRGNMVHVVIEVDPDGCTRLHDPFDPSLLDQPPVKLLVWLNVNGTWAKIDDAELGYCLFDPPKIASFVGNVVEPILAAIEQHRQELMRALEALDALKSCAST